jgi:hypothetical protein
MVKRRTSNTMGFQILLRSKYVPSVVKSIDGC